MSIKADVEELRIIQIELKTMTERRKKLKQRETLVKERISAFLQSKDQPGVKTADMAIRLEQKETHERLKPKDKDQLSISILEKYGIKDSSKVLEELMEARKGNTIMTEKLTIQKMKKGKKKKQN